MSYYEVYKKVEDVLCESLTFEMQSYNFKDFDLISSKNLNFDDAIPLHWLARIHLHAPTLISRILMTPGGKPARCWDRLGEREKDMIGRTSPSSNGLKIFLMKTPAARRRNASVPWMCHHQ